MRESGHDFASSENTVKKLLYRMRQRYRWLLRDEVSQTVENPADIDDELHYLCGALAVVQSTPDKRLRRAATICLPQ